VSAPAAVASEAEPTTDGCVSPPTTTLLFLCRRRRRRRHATAPQKTVLQEPCAQGSEGHG